MVWTKRVMAALYAPCFWFGFIGLAIWIVGYRAASLWLLIALAAAAIAVALLAERALPYDAQWNQPRGDGARDVAHAMVNELLNSAGVAAWLLLIAAIQPFDLGRGWPTGWPFWLQALLAIIVADAGITLAHYASHRIDALWRLHAVHHSVRRMYGFNGLMKHPLHQTVEATAAMMPLLALGMPQPLAAVVAFAIVIQLLLQHSNVDMRLGPLRYVFAFAPVHRFHHIRYGRSGDINFGLFFNLWDYLLGTAYYTDRYRVRSQDLGIGQRPDYPIGYLEQMREPFKAARATASVPPTPEALLRR